MRAVSSSTPALGRRASPALRQLAFPLCRATSLASEASSLRSYSSSSSRYDKIEDYKKYLSPQSAARKPSAIRKLMPLLSRPGMVSLGGGLPNPNLFPFTSLKFGVKDPTGDAAELDLSPEEVAMALQYSPTPGVPGLVKKLRSLQSWEHGRDIGPDGDYDVAVTVGSQDGLTKGFEMLLDPSSGDDELFVESPTYSGALAFLQPFGIKMTPVGSDGQGIRPEVLEDALAKSPGKGRRVLYVIPTAQNPSGSSLTNDRRRAVYELAQKHDIIILEDDPYFFLHPKRKSLDSFLSLDFDGRVLRFDSMSKLISSGIRIGFTTGPKPLMERLGYHVQATNLHNSGLSQILTQKLLDHWGEAGFDLHATRVAEFYTQRRDVLLSAAERHLSELAEWDVPEAGMFLWIKLLGGITDTTALIEEKAAAANVLFVPGQSFDPLDRPSPYVRASYSTASDEEMDLAMERLAGIVKGEIGMSVAN